jgi:hypothetical protein
LIPLTAARRQQLTTLSGKLQKLEPTNGFLIGVAETERKIYAFLDPLLQKVGLVPGGWSLKDNDDARRLAAKAQLKRLGTALAEADVNASPENLTLTTLAELNMDPAERDRVLSAFSGFMLDAYEKRGQSGYTLNVRARDTRQTAYSMDETGKITEGK